MVLSVIPSIYPSPPLNPSLSPLARGEECYPVVAGHRATRRQAITAAEQEKDEDKMDASREAGEERESSHQTLSKV